MLKSKTHYLPHFNWTCITEHTQPSTGVFCRHWLTGHGKFTQVKLGASSYRMSIFCRIRNHPNTTKDQEMPIISTLYIIHKTVVMKIDNLNYTILLHSLIASEHRSPISISSNCLLMMGYETNATQVKNWDRSMFEMLIRSYMYRGLKHPKND